MCETRMVFIDQVLTPIRLDKCFWDVLALIAKEQNLSVSRIIQIAHEELYTVDANSDTRVFTLRYYNQKTSLRRNVLVRFPVG